MNKLPRTPRGVIPKVNKGKALGHFLAGLRRKRIVADIRRIRADQEARDKEKKD